MYDITHSCFKVLTPCSFRWFIVAESTVRWFVVREKHCWMAADSADKSKQTGCKMLMISSHELSYGKF
jgi:hypothetical protein